MKYSLAVNLFSGMREGSENFVFRNSFWRSFLKFMFPMHSCFKTRKQLFRYCTGWGQNHKWSLAWEWTLHTWPPLVTENIRVVPPHCFTYHRNQRAETSWVSAVTHRFTKRVASCFEDLLRKKQEQNWQIQVNTFFILWEFIQAINLLGKVEHKCASCQKLSLESNMKHGIRDLENMRFIFPLIQIPDSESACIEYPCYRDWSPDTCYSSSHPHLSKRHHHAPTCWGQHSRNQP